VIQIYVKVLKVLIFSSPVCSIPKNKREQFYNVYYYQYIFTKKSEEGYYQVVFEDMKIFIIFK